MAHTSVNDFLNEETPRDAQVIALLLNSMGVKEWEPRVVPQLLEFMHRYVSEVLLDAQDYATHAGHQNVDTKDLRLAIESRLEKGAQPLPRQELLRLAKRKNAQPLPSLPYKVPGVVLPPEEYCLIKENYQVVPRTDPLQQALQQHPLQPY